MIVSPLVLCLALLIVGPLFPAVDALVCFNCTGAANGSCAITSSSSSSRVSSLVDCGQNEICFTSENKRGCLPKPVNYTGDRQLIGNKMVCDSDACNSGPASACLETERSCSTFNSTHCHTCCKSEKCNINVNVTELIICYQCSQIGPDAEKNCAITEAKKNASYLSVVKCKHSDEVCLTRKEMTTDGSVASFLRTCLDAGRCHTGSCKFDTLKSGGVCSKCSSIMEAIPTTSTPPTVTPSSGQENLVRLVNGSDFSKGILEVYRSGEWGTVCDRGWRLKDANVVCRQLGFPSASSSTLSLRYGQSEARQGKIWMENVTCKGTEESIFDCSYTPFGDHKCDHYEDVSVTCNNTLLRLVNSSNSFEGRLEVYHGGEWGTVCNRNWGIEDANVVCRQFGFPRAVGTPKFGSGNGRIWMNNVSCSGNEEDMFSCSFRGWGVNNCSHEQDAGIQCGTVQLVTGSGSFEGIVEVYYKNTWGSVCEDGWRIEDANVVCRQLGFPRAKSIKEFRRGSGRSWTGNVHCKGNETSLSLCHFNDWGNTNCGFDAGIKCVNVRLANGSSSHEGRVEVLHAGEWGTVCDENWGFNESNVVCRQLGYNGAKRAKKFSNGTGKIWMNKVQCSRKEEDLTSCLFDGWGNITCNHSQDAGVECDTLENPSPTVSQPENTNEPSPATSNLTLTIAVVAAVAAGTFLLAVIVFCVVRKRREKKNLQKNSSHIVLPSYNPPFFKSEFCDLSKTPDQWEVELDALFLEEILGQGFFGIVLKGKLSRFYLTLARRQPAFREANKHRLAPRTIACKMLKETSNEENALELVKEINLMKKVGQHKHIVSIVGCITRNHPLCLMLEFCANGDLLNYLKRGRKAYSNKVSNFETKQLADTIEFSKYDDVVVDIDTAPENLSLLNGKRSEKSDSIILRPGDMISFAHQIASGMEYLSGREVVHRDLACRNVLVTDNKVLKVSDFGLARQVYKDGLYAQKSSTPIPYRWMPVEALLYRQFSEKSDIWSFGVVLWEICTLGGFPYPLMTGEDVIRYLLKGKRLDQPCNCSNEFFAVMTHCWNKDTEKRPCFGDLVKTLKAKMESVLPDSYIDFNVSCLAGSWDVGFENESAVMSGQKSFSLSTNEISI